MKTDPMIPDRRTVLAAGAAVIVGGAPALAWDADYDAALDAVFARTGPVALAGGVVTREGLVWSGVRGERRFGGSDPATLDDRWHLGSNTKAMTAALYGRLVEQGRAEWDAPLSALFPGMSIDPAWDGTTIRDFMRHRAGVKDAAALGLFFLTARTDPRPLPEQRLAVAQIILSAPPRGTPGAFEYSNAGYMLVGAAIEQITGRDWADLMRRELFEPLGLSSGGFGPPAHDARGGENVWGHRGRGEGRVAMAPDDPGADNPLALGPAGTAHMTLGDYAAWLKVFLTDGGGWLSPDTVALMTTPGEGQDGGMPYGLGWGVVRNAPWADGPVLAHDGSNTMWYATALVAPSRGAAFIALSNQGDGAGATALAQGLVRAFGG